METSRPYHHGNLKTALVEAGLEILAADGLPGLSMRAIASRVGVSHTAPKNHFGSLRGLLTAISAEGFRRHVTAMTAGLRTDAPREARFARAVDGYVDFALANPSLFELMFSPLHCDQAEPELKAEGERSRAVLTDIARDLEWDRPGGPADGPRTEAMIWSMVHGYAKLRLAGLLKPTAGTGRIPTIADVMPAVRYSQVSG